MRSKQESNRTLLKQSLTIVFIIIMIFLILSLRHKNIESTASQLMTHATGEMLRGIAIIFLIFGHLAIHCIEGTLFFKYAGVWAVIVFLFISGVALSKNYGEKRLGVSFFLKRATRILPAYWIALTLFFVLDYLLLNQHFSLNLLAWNYLCFRPTSLPIGVSWFITYILVQYIIFWISINVGYFNYIKIIILSAISIFNSLIIYQFSFLVSIYGFWIIYTMVFPYSCVIGIYHKQVYSILRSFYSWSRIFYISLMLFLLIFYVINFEYSTHLLYYTSLLIKLFTYLTFPLLIVAGLAMLTYLLDNFSFKSRL